VSELMGHRAFYAAKKATQQKINVVAGKNCTYDRHRGVKFCPLCFKTVCYFIYIKPKQQKVTKGDLSPNNQDFSIASFLVLYYITIIRIQYCIGTVLLVCRPVLLILANHSFSIEKVDKFLHKTQNNGGISKFWNKGRGLNPCIPNFIQKLEDCILILTNQTKDIYFGTQWSVSVCQSGSLWQNVKLYTMNI
jgi:hypothetical protein